MCSFIVNKLRATDSSISPGLINKLIKIHSIYISVPWFRFTLMDHALKVLFHQFQIIFDWIRLTLSVAKLNQQMQSIQLFPRKVSTVSTAKPRRSCSSAHELNKFLEGLNEHLNSIILERTIEYNTTQPQNPTAKESNALRWRAHGKKVQSVHGLLTCSYVCHIGKNVTYSKM